MVFLGQTFGFGSWLLGQLGNVVRRRLGEQLLGGERERALAAAVQAAIKRAARELRPDGSDQDVEHLAAVLDQVFQGPVPIVPIEEQPTILQALQAGIATQLAVLDDAGLTATGQSSAQALGLPAQKIIQTLVSNVVWEILTRGADGGPLAPLANQLNHDGTHLQFRDIADTLGPINELSRRTGARVDRGSEAALDRAVLAVPPAVRSPARLLRARSGVVPYTARVAALRRLEGWLSEPDAFSVRLVGGRGGTGKTRLGVELCQQAEAAGWLCGLLRPSADPQALKALVQIPKKRLVVIDYAETRLPQLEALLPRLASHATPEEPVRVLLLLRAAPRRSGAWTEALSWHSDALDSIVAGIDVDVLDDAPLGLDEREELYVAAATAFAQYEPSATVPPPPTALADPLYAQPLLVVVAAYLGLHDGPDLPATRAELLEGLISHEDRYWAAGAADLDVDRVLRRRVVALVTLAGGASEGEAVQLLRLIPDLGDATNERLGRLARWVHDLYPGSRWWNALEPDLLGEHLVADCFTNEAVVLAGVLDGRSPAAVIQPLDLWARAVGDYSALAAAVRPILSAHLSSLASMAIEQARTETDLDVLLGAMTVAAALERVVQVVPPDPQILPEVLSQFPPERNVALDTLACTLTAQLVEWRRKSGTRPYDLALCLNNLANHLGATGRWAEAIAASKEAVTLLRGLAVDNTAAYASDLAMSLDNLATHCAKAGQKTDALSYRDQAVTVLQRLAADDPVAHERDLAWSLNQLSVDLAEHGRLTEALAASDRAVTMLRPLAADNPAIAEPALAMCLNNFSSRLAGVLRYTEAVDASEEAVTMLRPLAADHPATHTSSLALYLDNLAVNLARAGRSAKALAASEEAVALYRRLAAANPAAHERDFALCLNNFAAGLATARRPAEALAAIQEAVALYRRLAAANPAAHERDLAQSLEHLAYHMDTAGRHDEAHRIREEAQGIIGRLRRLDRLNL